MQNLYIFIQENAFETHTRLQNDSRFILASVC